MKFGKTLLQNEIPEWSKSYLSYKALKKAIKEAGVRLPPSEESTTAILFQLDRELEKVNTFYMYKRSQIDRRFWIVSEKYNQYCKATSYYLDPSTTTTTTTTSEAAEAAAPTTSHDDTKELISALQETRAQMRRILWFAEMNAQGFRKILKKLDKKLGLDTQQVYWETKVAQLPFVTQDEIVKNIDTLTQWLSDMAVNDPVSGASTPASAKYYQTGIIRDLGKHESLAHAIDDDRVDQMKQQLQVLGSGSVDQKFGYAMLERAAIKGSPSCLEYLLSYVKVNPMGRYDINERNLLHKLCIGVREDWVEENAFSKAIQAVVQKLLEVAPDLNTQVDCIGRRPLHYAAEFGQAALAQLFLCQAIDTSDYNNNKGGFADPAWQDREGHTPLFLAILHGNYLTLKELVETGKINDIDGIIAAASAQRVPNGGVDEHDDAAATVPEYVHRSHHPSATALACNVCNLDLLQLLIAKGASVNLADEDGETALLIAARHHFTEGVRILIDQGHADVNHAENINGWTALMIAAMEGCMDIVQLLLDHDADKAATDSNGWAAYEHAVFRGYLDIGRMTKPDNIPDRIDNEDTRSIGKNESLSHHALEARSRAGRLYGHKYLTDQSMIIIKLGSNDIRNPSSTQFMNLQDNTLEDQRLSIAVSAVNATGELPIVDLPPTNQLHLLDIEPIILSSSNPESVVLRFDLVETFGASHGNNIIARATATLATDQIYTKSRGFKGQAPGNSSLRGQQTVPIIRSSTLEYIGTVGFEYFVVTPFTHPNMTVGDRYTYYKSLDTKIIGHRGSGMNQRSSHLQVGENTVLSFITAASLGAEYVEFDVQLTKDLVPVIYHDWTVTETGFDIPLNAITSEQFLNLRPSGHIKEYHTGVSDDHPNGQLSPKAESRPPIVAPAYESPPSSEDDSSSLLAPIQGKRRAARSNSMSAISSKQMHGRTLASKRLELTRTNKLGKLKGNGPESIQAPFTTLAEALKKIPKTAGLNIEVKYPMVDEAEGDELYQFQEINIFVDTILECVYDHAAQDRRIIFSSFHPEICVALNLKQPNYPVFFLTDAGTLSVADVRCNSLQGGMRFAKQADLLGIVAASEPILQAPRMVKVIKESGLLLFTYGVLNNVVGNALAQRNYGVDAVIVDSVVAVRKGLRGDNQVSA